MAPTIVLLIALVLTVVAAILIWRGTRRLSTVGYLKDVTVSRQWLVQHQADDGFLPKVPAAPFHERERRAG